MKEKNNTNEDENIINMMKIDDLEIIPDKEKYRLQCMFPDYVFNKLTEQEQKDFEQAITNYPDLEAEVKDAKALFAHIEKFDYKKMMYDKSQYLPDRVVENLERRNILYRPWKPSWKRVIALGFFAAIFLVYFYFIGKEEQQMANYFDIPTFTDTEMEMIVDDIYDISFEDINDNPSYLQYALLDNNADLQELEDYYVSSISIAFEEVMQSKSAISLSLQSDYMYLLEELEYIDEDTFQALLNQMSNL